MKYILGLIVLLSVSPALAENCQLNPAIDELFDNARVRGTIVVLDYQSGSCTVHDPVRAGEQFVPGSTFKIANTLIGLSSGAVKDVDEILPYGGKPQPFNSWQRDMSLREAITISNVAIYQQLARRIGLKQMKQSITALDYGNSETGRSVDTFWLDGPLKISAVEQTMFLARLATDNLSFPQDAMDQTQEILLLEHGKNWSLFAKTGWSQKIGWWVGWVVNKGRVYSFALNIDLLNMSDAHKRKEIGKSSLRILGLID